MAKHAGGRPTKYESAMCKKYIELSKEGKSKLSICSELGIGFDAFQDYQVKYPEFTEAVKEGQRLSQAWWEEEGRKATFGAKPGFNATSFIFNMANRFKDDWKNKQEVENTGKVEHDVTVRGLSETADFLSGIIAKRSKGTLP